MFNTTNVTEVVEKAVPYIRTVEHKHAATPESVKLYKEMLAEVNESVLASFKSDNNCIMNFSGVITHSPDSFDTQVLYEFMLNGCELHGAFVLKDSFGVRPQDYIRDTNKLYELKQQVNRAIGNRIAEEIQHNTVHAILRKTDERKY